MLENNIKNDHTVTREKDGSVASHEDILYCYIISEELRK